MVQLSTAEEYQFVKLQSLASTDGTKFCVGELELYDSYRQISLQQYSDCSASSTEGDNACENAFQGDGDAEVGFCSDPKSSLIDAGTALDGADGFLILYMQPGDDVTKFTITAMTDGGGAYAPTSFVLYGSNGGGDWVELYEEDGLEWEDGESQTFYVDGSCDARNRYGSGDSDYDETCQEKGYSACNGAYAELCEWKEESYFASCLDILLDGTTQNGVYDLLIGSTFLKVYCDMSIGGWTRVINVPDDEDQTAIFSQGTSSIGTDLTGSGELYKLDDDVINTLMGDDPTIQYRCGSVDYFVTREDGWITALDQDGWLIDRDMDGTPDCAATREGYLFSDYNEDDINPVDGASIEECNTAGHTDFGYYDGTELGCYNSEDDWGNRAHVYVRGKSSSHQTIKSCSDLERSDWTGIYLTDYGALYCNQDFEGGGIYGGWTLLMKTTTSGNLLQFDADYWTAPNTLNGDSMFTYHINFQPQQAKLEPFNGNHAGYRIEFNEYLAYWPSFDDSDGGANTWYIGVFESLTALEFFQTERTLSGTPADDDSFNGDYFSSETDWGKSGICYSGADTDSSVRWGYVFASADGGNDVMALGGIGLDALEFPNGISSGDETLSDINIVATYSGAEAQTSYPVELYGRVYTGATYDDCTSLPPDADTGLYYNKAVFPMYCNNELEDGGWTMMFKTIGDGTEITYTGDYIDDATTITQDPPILSVNTASEDAKFWTYSTTLVDQLLFYWPETDQYFMTGVLAEPMTTQEYLATYDTYQSDAPLDEGPTLVFGRAYFDGGVCARKSILDCTVKYFADSVVDNILIESPAPSPMNEPTLTSSGYLAVGADCNTYSEIEAFDDLGYTETGSIGASIIACGDICDGDDECGGFQLTRAGCTIVKDVSEAVASPNGNDNLAITGGDICYGRIAQLFTTAPPPMWDELPDTVYLGDTFDGWGMWDDDATEDWQYCADSIVTDSCDPMSLDECLALCESEQDAEFCSYGAYASSGSTENNEDGPGGSECCIATATCSSLTTSSEAQAAHYAIYQRLHQQTSTYRSCNMSTDCNDGFYCAAYLLQADEGSATAELFLGTSIAETKVMCMPCVDTAGETCDDFGDAIDSCDVCTDFADLTDMPIVERECGLDQFVDPDTGECNACTTSCDEGYYLSGDRCTGEDTSDPIECVECTSNCGLGKYKVGTCSGLGWEDEVTCSSCIKSCDEGFFVDSSHITEDANCLGKGYQSPVCSPCTSRCNEGFYLDGTCDGDTDENAVTCVECENVCDEGEYLDHVCSGTGTSDDTSCIACKSECATDEFLVGTCDGTGSHDSVFCQKCQMICEDGQYFESRCDGSTTEDPLVCADCTTECDDGYFMQGVCDGQGDSDDVVCVSCDDCTGGEVQSDGLNCEATCLGSPIGAVPDPDAGQTNVVSSTFSFIGGGVLNSAEGQYAVISAGLYNVASATNAVIGGGEYNTVVGSNSAIGSGGANYIGSIDSFIGGGQYNTIQDGGETNTIGAGVENVVSGKYHVIHGGDTNAIIAYSYSTLAGGQYNTIEGKWGTILGGKNNYVSGNYATVLGGANNVILSSNFGVIAGGNKNTVEGKMSIAIGSKAETRAAYSATFGFQKNVCETRADRVVNFCADEVAINGQPVLTLFVSRRRALAEDEEAVLKGVSDIVFKQEAELAALDEEMNELLEELDALIELQSSA